MPRWSSGGRSASRPRPPAHAPLHNPSQPAHSRSKGVRRSFGTAVADGLAFGIGKALANWAVDAVMGPRVIHYKTVATPAPITSSLGGADACGDQFDALQDCLNNNESDISRCQFYMDVLQECCRSSASGLSA